MSICFIRRLASPISENLSIRLMERAAVMRVESRKKNGNLDTFPSSSVPKPSSIMKVFKRVSGRSVSNQSGKGCGLVSGIW